MIIKALKYSRHANSPKEWCIVGNNGEYANFTNINLFVGKNASGKSRTLTAIREIATLMSGIAGLNETIFSSQGFDILFEEKVYTSENKEEIAETIKYRYILDFCEREVLIEKLYKNGDLCFSREGDKIEDKYKVLDGISFAKYQLIITSKNKDGKYIFPLFPSWGGSLRNYLFADQFEKRALIEDLSLMDDIAKNKEVVGLLLFTFYMGKDKYGDKFVQEILECIHALGYNEITNLDIIKTKKGYCLGVEEDNAYMVSQEDMSQGMFRTLSLFVFIIYARLRKISACVLIDDIGEGVDFDRSRKLIGQIIKKLNNTSVQCFMSTNDRYVMNDIPLRFWIVIDRDSSKKSILYDYQNAKDIYEDFKFTGLNNFEFLTTDFYKDGFAADDEENENDDTEF